jgi:hypothetical protein
MTFKGRQAVSRRLFMAEARVRAHVGCVMDKVALGQVFSESFGLPLSVSFRRCSIFTHHLGDGHVPVDYEPSLKRPSTIRVVRVSSQQGSATCGPRAVCGPHNLFMREGKTFSATEEH